MVKGPERASNLGARRRMYVTHGRGRCGSDAAWQERVKVAEAYGKSTTLMLASDLHNIASGPLAIRRPSLH